MIASACALAIVLAFAAEPAEIDDPVARAEQHFQRGEALEQSVPKDDPVRAREILDEAHKEYLAASEAFGAAYESTKRSVFLYARAQAARLGARCDLALGYYDEFLATSPPAEAVAQAKANRKRCTAKEPAAAVPPPRMQPQPDDGTPTPRDTPRRQWIRDPAGGVLVALGGVTSIIGVSLIGFATTRDGSAVSAGNEDEYLNRKNAARIQHRVGIAATAVGGAMLIAGFTRWGVLASRERKQRVNAGVAGSRRGAALTVSVWF
jgi:hypothetical protein